jgi:cardiolipin synthase
VSDPGDRILTLPNALTLLRVVLLPVILWSILEQRFAWALWLLVAAGISDFLDGYLARLLQQASTFGLYLDPIADKLLLSSSFLVLSMADEQIPWLVTGLVLARDATIIITVVVLVVSTDLRKFPPSALGKWNTVMQLIAVYVVLGDIVYRWQILHWARNASMVLVTFLVIASGTQYAFLMLRRVVTETKKP